MLYKVIELDSDGEGSFRDPWEGKPFEWWTACGDDYVHPSGITRDEAISWFIHIQDALDIEHRHGITRR